MGKRNKITGPIAARAAGLGAALSPFSAGLAWAQESAPYYGHSMMWQFGWYGWLLGPLMMIAFIAVVVAVVVLVVRWVGGSGHAGTPNAPSGKTPLDILKERFARGEMDAQEFEERRRVLGE